MFRLRSNWFRENAYDGRWVQRQEPKLFGRNLRPSFRWCFQTLATGMARKIILNLGSLSVNLKYSVFWKLILKNKFPTTSRSIMKVSSFMWVFSRFTQIKCSICSTKKRDCGCSRTKVVIFEWSIWPQKKSSRSLMSSIFWRRGQTVEHRGRLQPIATLAGLTLCFNYSFTTPKTQENPFFMGW